MQFHEHYRHDRSLSSQIEQCRPGSNATKNMMNKRNEVTTDNEMPTEFQIIGQRFLYLLTCYRGIKAANKELT